MALFKKKTPEPKPAKAQEKVKSLHEIVTERVLTAAGWQSRSKTLVDAAKKPKKK